VGIEAEVEEGAEVVVVVAVAVAEKDVVHNLMV
jgi:hypothetical protein